MAMVSETITVRSSSLRQWIDWRTRELHAAQVRILVSTDPDALSWLELRSIARREWHDANGTYDARKRLCGCGAKAVDSGWCEACAEVARDGSDRV